MHHDNQMTIMWYKVKFSTTLKLS